MSKTPVKRGLFGTDGVRGRANEFPMTPEVALQLGRAIALVAQKRLRALQAPSRRPAPTAQILIGKDTRLSGYMLETALASGVCSMGANVLLTGPLPTPAVAQLTHSMRADAGVVISASHNPFEDNGIKLFGPDGYKLADEEELEVERLIADETLAGRAAAPRRIGKAERIEEASGRYVVYAKNTFPTDLNLRGIKLVVDAAHGAAYRVAPDVFHELGANVFSLGCAPDGKNINKRCGALHPEHVAHEVRRRHADIGVALDGDADRVIIVDEKGDTVDGDALMAICATRMLREKRLKRRTVVATVMSNMGLEHALAASGGRLVRTQVGDRYVVERMRASGYNFGGEQSGHLVFSDHSTTGDGVVAALQALAVMVREQRPLSELRAVMTRVPQVLQNVTLPVRMAVASMPTLSRCIAQAEKQLGKRGRVLVRWSGTENLLRLMLEGPSPQTLDRLASAMADAAHTDASRTSRSDA